MNIAENAAIKHDVPVAIFSMEMSSLQLVMRLFSSLGQIDQTDCGPVISMTWTGPS